jgi:glycosyltransferase involved in cell wall biosynthesis
MRLTDWVTPLKPLEALAMGKVVVASDVGGIKELIQDNETGWLFRAGDSEALTQTLRAAIAQKDRWPELGERGRQHVAATRRWSDIVTRYRTVYEQASSHAGRERRP